jgi:hypothetical protein
MAGLSITKIDEEEEMAIIHNQVMVHSPSTSTPRSGATHTARIMVVVIRASSPSFVPTIGVI